MLKYIYDASGNVVMWATVSLPQITRQPASLVTTPGAFVTFSVVVADAHAIAFQWQVNGANIPGATGDSLVLTDVNPTNVGQYSVVVTNSAGSVTSDPAELLLDRDGDGLPDTWEQEHFTNPDATPPLHPVNQRSETDPDEDLISNLDEFLDNTNPMNAASLKPRLTAYSDAGGSVTITPMKLSYETGETVTVTAEPFAPAVFTGWDGHLNGNDNPATLLMDNNKTVRARFASAATLPPGLIATWRGETDASDLMGGHNGTTFAGASVTAPNVTASGKVGGAFTFDGTGYVRVPDTPALRPAQFTAEAWVFPSGLSFNPQAIVARGNYVGTWHLSLVAGNVPQFNSHGGQSISGPSRIPVNQWTHLAISFDGLNKRLYVNGAQVAGSGVGRALVYDAAPVPVTIGADWSVSEGIGSLFQGRIDEISLYARALATDEVFAIYSADSLGKNFSRPYIISLSQLPSVVIGASFNQQFETLLGAAPVSFSLLAGALPPGMDLSSSGLVHGSPSIGGIFDFTVQATDSAGASSEQLCILEVL